MNTPLPGYQLIEALHEGVKTVIYRGKRKQSPRSVIVKTLKSEYPTLEEIARLRHEYKIIQHLDIEGIVKPYALENYQNGLALILSDFGGDSLKNLMNSEKIPLFSFLSIAIQLASILASLHQKNIIHKDIKPHNILIYKETWTVIIIDFSIATRLSRENPKIDNPELLEGTLAYMSPEQTGRMNRSIDYRTDFYSLGITFYEMLTGSLPFNATDPLELVHCHIAKQPKPPHLMNPEIPQAISDIVMKLMAKTAEDRYQSALGLKADLEICFNQLQAKQKIENFIPGQLDKSGQFLIPQKLYGREAEVAQLLDAFERVKGNSQSQIPNQKSKIELMLVSGYSGIGKSCLVNEVHKPIVGARGYFIAGKFDQFKRQIPYAALIQAFQDLCRALLTESGSKIARWKEKLSEAFEQNGQLIIDVIPEVERIVGKQPAATQLGPTESQNRFNRVFQKFIQVFTQPEHPLVLFLDDLQWADSASLKLIELLMTEADSKYLLLIGAYRDNEVYPTHPTIQTIEKIQQAGAVVNNIVLQPLDFGNVSQLVADTLGESPVSFDPPLPPLKKGGFENGVERTLPLAELLFNKTQGNPFFLTQLLQTLHSEKLLTFDFGTGVWQWDMGQIQALGITDYNVVELVARNIQKLPLTTQEVLKLSACIGNRFNLDVLAIAFDKSESDTAIALWDALQAGLVLPLSDAYKIPMLGDWGHDTDSELPPATRAIASSSGGSSKSVSCYYKFLHDRVQQAAYSLIPDDDKKETHLKIGQLLLKNTPGDEIEENIFDIVNQLNIGVDFITQQSEKDELAKLNLIAGKKALAATAYEAAVRYLNVGLGLLPESGWTMHYDLTLELYVETVAAEYLTTNFERAKMLSDVVLSRAKSLLEKVKVYETKVQFYIAQNQMEAAVDTGLQVLKMLGVYLPLKPSKLRILQGLIQTKLTVGRKRIEELADLPPMTDPYKIAAMRILNIILAPVFFVAPDLVPLVTFTIVNLCLKYGISPLAAYGYTLYGLLLSAGMGDIDSGYQFGQLAVRLLEQFDAKELKPKVQVLFNGGIRHWKDHARETIEPFFELIQIGLEVGDIEGACYSAMDYCTYPFLIGEHLESVAHNQKKYIEMMLKYKQEFQMGYTNIWSQAVLNLLGKSADKCRLIGESFNESEMLPQLIKLNNGMSVYCAYFLKAYLLYLFKDYAGSVEHAKLAEKYAASVLGFLTLAAHNLYYSLAILALYPTASSTQQKEYMRQVVLNQKKLKKWAYHAPENHQHKYSLVEAVRCGVLGQNVKAIAYYDLAIKGAKDTGYIQEEALANELAAEFYFSRSREKIAQVYLTEAYYGYIRWGASAKVKDLESRYPQIFSQMLKRETPSFDVTRTTTSTTTGASSTALDVVTVMKASQALSGEIVLDKLLSKLMHIAIENAGARKGFILLSKAGKLVLGAEGDVEKDKAIALPSVPIEERLDLPLAAINYVARTGETVVLNNATVEGLFTTDPYIVRSLPLSILCLPLIHQGKFTGILYLENNLSVGAFTQKRLEVLKLLASQASISLENASYYEELQTYSSQLESKNAALEKAMHELASTQTQLVQSEKLSSLGQLVAGVAHEINNPVSFISGNLCHANNYAQDILKILQLYQQHYPNPAPEIQEEAEASDLDFVVEDFVKMLESMKLGTDRIRDIVVSLRNFSRLDAGDSKPVDIHEGIDTTLLILHHRMKGCGGRAAIEVIKEYGDLPPVECYSGQLNQVFMNLIANAIDALDESSGWSPESKVGNTPHPSPMIRIRTEVIDGDWVAIAIADNGPGMTLEVRSKLFDPFFTTKPVGKGTGLGLSISYQIVVEKHKGSLECISTPGLGAEFLIKIPSRQQL